MKQIKSVKSEKILGGGKKGKKNMLPWKNKNLPKSKWLFQQQEQIIKNLYQQLRKKEEIKIHYT